MKEVLSQNDVKFAYVDITSSMLHLKNFLKIRDNNASHASVRESGRVGIPTLFVEGETFTVEGAEHAEKLVKELNLAE